MYYIGNGFTEQGAESLLNNILSYFQGIIITNDKIYERIYLSIPL